MTIASPGAPSGTGQLEADRRLKQMRLLLEISSHMSSYLSARELLAVIVRRVRDVVEADSISVMLAHSDTGLLSIVASEGLTDAVVRDLKVKPGEGVAGIVFQTSQALNIPDTSRDPRFVRRKDDHARPRRLLCVPITSSAGCLGVVSIERRIQKPAFDGGDLELLMIIANQAAISIRNAQLYQDLQARLRNLSIAQEIGNILVSTLNIDAILNLVVDGIVEVLGADICSIMLLDEESRHLTVVASKGLPEEARQARVPVGTGISGYVAREGRPLLIKNLDEDTRFQSQRSDRYGTKSLLSVPLIARGRVVGVINVNTAQKDRVWNEADQNLLTMFANQAAIALENARLYKQMEVLALTDAVTGIHNHRSFQEQLASQLARAQRYGIDVALIILDLDFFKRVNDRYGHQVGDQVLAGVGARLQSGVRLMDFVARYGGEEFAIILPHCPLPAAVERAERIRVAIEKEALVPEHPEMFVTLSAGVGAFPETARSPEELIRLTDEALYRAKADGRNCVRAAVRPLLRDPS